MTLERWPRKPISQVRKQTQERWRHLYKNTQCDLSPAFKVRASMQNPSSPKKGCNRNSYMYSQCVFSPPSLELEPTLLAKHMAREKIIFPSFPCTWGWSRGTTSWPMKWNQNFSSCSFYGNSSHRFFCFAFGHTAWHAGSQFADKVWNPCPLHWKRRVLTTGPPGKSH